MDYSALEIKFILLVINHDKMSQTYRPDPGFLSLSAESPAESQAAAFCLSPDELSDKNEERSGRWGDAC